MYECIMVLMRNGGGTAEARGRSLAPAMLKPR